MVYIVLGMHKSGTTLISDLMHKSGINMVDEIHTNIDYDRYGGKMERQSFLDLNHKILNSKNINSLDIPVKLLINEKLNDYEQEIKELIKNYSSKYEHWGFKDPRTCITYPLFNKYIPEHKLIVVYRHPSHIIDHYGKHYKYFKKIKEVKKAVQRYKDYNKNILKILNENKHPFIVINYHELMTDERVLASLSDFLKRQISDTRDLKRYRNKNKNSLKLQLLDMLSSGNAQTIYNELEKLKVK